MNPRTSNLKRAFQKLDDSVPLTLKMVLLTIVIGLVFWIVLDHVQTSKLRKIFHAQLTEKLSEHAMEDRLSFNRYVTSFPGSVRLFVTQKHFSDYVERKKWSAEDTEHIKYHRQPPVWLPKRSMLKTFVQPRYALLLDSLGRTKEVYQSRQDTLPSFLLTPTRLLIEKSQNQNFMTTMDNVHYLVTSESYFNSQGKKQATLMFASPIDEEFLLASLSSFSENRLVALMTSEEEPRILTSSNMERLPPGTPLSTLQSRYLVTGKEFIDYGASEMQIKLVSFASITELGKIANPVISKARQDSTTLALVLILTSALMTYWISRRIQQITRHITDFSKHTLGMEPQELQKRDQLQIFKERFQYLTEEVVEAREIIKRQAEELTNQIVNNSFDAVITLDTNGVVELWNSRAETIFGWSCDEVVGQMTVDTIIPKQYLKVDEKALQYSLTKEKEPLFNKQVETTAFHRDGHEFPVELSVSSAQIGEDYNLITIIHDITKRKKREEELRKFKFISDNSYDAYFLFGRDAKFQYVNKTACRMLGYSEEEFLTLGFPDIDRVYDIEKYQELFDLIQKETIPPVETINRRKDGTVFTSEITVKGYLINGKTYMFAVLRDVTERKQIEEALKESENKFRTIFNNAIDGILLAEPKSKKFYTGNKKICRMLGYSPEEIESLGVVDIHPEKELPGIIKKFERQAKGEIEIATNIPVKRKDRTVFYADINSSFITLKGKAYMLGIFRDITDRKKADEERQAHIHFLDKMELINRAILQATDLDQMMQTVLDTLLLIFGSDRAWLLHPCDPGALTLRVLMERTRPEYPGALAMGVDIPMTPEVIKLFQTVLDSDTPVVNYPASGRTRPKDISKQFTIQSQMLMAIHPKVGKSWLLGIHQCSHPRVWTVEEHELFKEISRRITDALSSLLFLRNLQESEEKYKLIAETAVEGIFQVDDSENFVFVNESFAGILGYKREELQGNHYSIVIPEKSIPEAKEIVEGIVSGNPAQGEFTLKHKLGHGVPVYFSMKALIKRGKSFGFSGIIHDITERKKAEEQIKASLEEKEILLKEIHHRVKNNLQIVCSLFNLQKETIKDKETLEMVSECQNRIRAIALVHEKLYTSESLANINFKEYITDLINSLFNFYEVNPNKITSKMDIDNILLGINSAIPCGLILNELLGNSLQYAFPKGREGEIKVTAHLIADEINIIVSDNGVGLPAEIDIINPASLGLQIVDILVKQLRGKIEIDRSNGTAFCVTLRLRK